MITKVYLAAPYSLRELAQSIRIELMDLGIVVTSHWITEKMPTDREGAFIDMDDVRRAEGLVLLNPPEYANSGSGGRHTEVGMALLLNMPIVIIGASSNIFHTLQQVQCVETVKQAAQLLKQINVRPRPWEPMTSTQMIDALCARVHTANKKWWLDLETGLPLTRNVGELLMLATSELAEAMEGHRKSLNDDKLPELRMFDVELIDALIRIFDICGGLVPSPGSVFEAKMTYNAVRIDHTVAHRLTEHGKKY